MKQYIKVEYSQGQFVITPTDKPVEADYKLVDENYSKNGNVIGGDYAPWSIHDNVTYWGYVKYGDFSSEVIKVTIDYKLDTKDQNKRNAHRKQNGLFASV